MTHRAYREYKHNPQYIVPRGAEVTVTFHHSATLVDIEHKGRRLPNVNIAKFRQHFTAINNKKKVRVY